MWQKIADIICMKLCNMLLRIVCTVYNNNAETMNYVQYFIF